MKNRRTQGRECLTNMVKATEVKNILKSKVKYFYNGRWNRSLAARKYLMKVVE